MKYLIPFAVCSLIPVALAEEINNMETIFVIATKTEQEEHKLPMITEKININSPANKDSTNLEDALKDANGVEVSGGPVKNSQQIRMRGYGGNNILLLIDGVRQNFSANHNSNILLDPSILKQVEILKGSSSSIYGSGGLGGVISFETKEAKDMLKEGQKVGFMEKLGYSTASHEKSSISSIYGASEKFDFFSNIALRKSGNLKLSNGSTFEYADSDVKSLMLKGSYAPSATSKIGVNFQSYKNQATEFANPQQETGKSNLVDKKTESNLAKIEYKTKPENNDLINLKLQGYYSESKIDYTNLEKTFALPVGGERKQFLSTTGIDLENTSILSFNRLTYGINFYSNNQKSESQGSAWGAFPEGNDKNIGIFIQDEVEFETRIGDFLIIPAARFDDYSSKAGNASSSDNAFSPSLSASFMPYEWISIFSSASEGFRAPTISEKYAYGQHFAIPFRPGVIYINSFKANPNLKAETNTTFEAGFSLKFKSIITETDSLKLKTSYYYTKAKNYIDQIIDQKSMGICIGAGLNCNIDKTYFDNIDSATINGVDLNLEYKLSKLTIDLGYSYVNGKDDNTGRYLGNLTPRTLKANISYEFLEGFTAGARGAFVGRFDENLAFGQQAVAGYSLYDLYLGYEYKDTLGLNVSLNNIFNKEHQKPNTSMFGLGRDLRITAIYKY